MTGYCDDSTHDDYAALVAVADAVRAVVGSEWQEFVSIAAFRCRFGCEDYNRDPAKREHLPTCPFAKLAKLDAGQTPEPFQMVGHGDSAAGECAVDERPWPDGHEPDFDKPLAPCSVCGGKLFASKTWPHLSAVHQSRFEVCAAAVHPRWDPPIHPNRQKFEGLLKEST